MKSSGSGERHIYLSKDATLTYEAGALKNSGISRIKLTDDGATVKLYSDALNTSHLTITKSSASVNLVVGADAKIARIHLWNTNSVDLNISFENDAILTINDMFRSGANFYECGHELFLTNFEDYGSTSSIRFSDATFIAKLQGVAASWVKDSFHADGWEDFYVDDGGYLHATRVIPEPSTYAVIFGCIALMLVLYRRRC